MKQSRLPGVSRYFGNFMFRKAKSLINISFAVTFILNVKFIILRVNFKPNLICHEKWFFYAL